MIRNLLQLFFLYYTFYVFLAFSIAGIAWRAVKDYKSSASDLWERITVCTVSVLLCGGFSFLASYVSLVPKYGYRAEIAAVVLLSAVFFALGAVSFRGLGILYRKIRDGALLNIIKENYVGLTVFIVFTLKFIIRTQKPDDWALWSYAVDYSIGFGPRFMIGTILSLLTHGAPTAKAVLIFCTAAVLCMIAVISAVLNAVAKKADEKIRPAILLFITSYVLSSGSIADFWCAVNFGRLDMYIFLITVLSVIAFQKTKNLYLRYLFLAVGCVLCNAIYQGFVFMFFSMTAIVILCDILLSPEDKKKRILLGSLVVLAAGASFLVFQLYSTLKFETAEEMIRYLKSHTDIIIKEEAVTAEYFGTTGTLFGYVLKYFAEGKNLRETFFVYFLFAAPQVIVFARVFLNNGFRLPGKKGVNLSLLSLSTLMFLLPQFLLNVDWGRWTMSGVTTVYFCIFYLSYIRETSMTDALTAFSKELKEKPTGFVILLIYKSVFDVFAADIVTYDFPWILKRVADVKDFLMGLLLPI